jgi:hypothetical protein
VFGLSADFGRNGSVDAVGHTAVNDGEPVELQIDATFESLHASLFDRPRFKNTDIVDGKLSANLAGPAVNQLDGDVQFSFRDTNIGTIRLAEPNLRATFVEGMAQYTASLRLAGQPITARGSARLFDETPTYDGVISLKSFDVARLGPSFSDWPTNLTGAVNVTGSRFSSPVLRMGIDLKGSRINRMYIADAIGAFTWINFFG